jgi:hypothetical protein
VGTIGKGSTMSFEPEIDEDLFDEDCDCKGNCLCDDYDDHALDEEKLEDLDDEDWEDS